MAFPLPHDARVRARYVFSVDGTVLAEPVENGTLRIQGGVADIDPESRRSDIDLGNVAIIPELVNAHTHLEFSSLDAPLLARPDDTFADWITAVLRWRSQRDTDDGQAHARSVEFGLKESVQWGVGMLGEIATQSPWQSAYQELSDPRSTDGAAADGAVIDGATDTDEATRGPHGIRFLELIGLGRERIDTLVAEAEHYLTRPAPTGWQAGLSPHAPYTAGWKLVESVARLSRHFCAPVAMHLAETSEELELLGSHRGPLVELLEERGVWDPSAVPQGIQPIDYLRTLSTAHRTLIIHGNYLSPSDWSFLAEHADAMSIVYCPRTFHYFGHRNYPLEEMLAAGVHVAIGTDSRASNPDLDLFKELQFIRQQHPNLAPREILKLGTENGAKALGLRPHRLGAVELPDREVNDDPFSLLFDRKDS